MSGRDQSRPSNSPGSMETQSRNFLLLSLFTGLEPVAKDAYLPAVFAFVPVEGIDDEIIQGV